MYTNFEDLYKAYGFDNPLKDRDDLSQEDERAFVANCFEIYEHIGFAKLYRSPYESHMKFNGRRFVVLGRVDETAIELGCLPMWYIRFEDGVETTAHPEEICLEEQANFR